MTREQVDFRLLREKWQQPPAAKPLKQPGKARARALPPGLRPVDVLPAPQLPGVSWGQRDAGAARGVCESLARCSPWAAHPRGHWLLSIAGTAASMAICGLFVAALLGLSRVIA